MTRTDASTTPTGAEFPAGAVVPAQPITRARATDSRIVPRETSAPHSLRFMEKRLGRIPVTLRD